MNPEPISEREVIDELQRIHRALSMMEADGSRFSEPERFDAFLRRWNELGRMLRGFHVE